MYGSTSLQPLLQAPAPVPRDTSACAGIIGGAKWEGKKTVIQDDDEAAASAETTYEGELPAAGDPSAAAEPSLAVQPEGEEPTSPRHTRPKSFKYSKIVRKLLRQVSFVFVSVAWRAANLRARIVGHTGLQNQIVLPPALCPAG